MNGSGHENEITQSGIELIGAKGLAADLEVLDMAVKVFEKCGISDYAIELGHAGFFGSLVRGLGVDDEKKEEIRRSIESKNYAELSLILSGIDDSPSAKVLKLLPSLYGGAEILDEAEKLCAGNGEAMEYLDYLRELYSKLSEISSDANINLDLGMVHRNNYYTGVVFRGYINGYGNTVISGGRYDGLMEKFGRPMPATGFAVDNNALISTLIASKGDKLMSKIDAVIYAERGYEAQAVMLAGNLADNGCISRICSSGGEEGAVSYAKELGAEKVYIVSNNIKTVDIEVSL